MSAFRVPRLNPISGRSLAASVHDEILRHKMQRCFDLLAHSEIGIGEVAKASGFRSVQYLNAVFKRELESTPAAWRQGHRGSDASSLEQAHSGENSPP